MPRIARVVTPEYPHYIIQRGNRRQKVFFNEDNKGVNFPLICSRSRLQQDNKGSDNKQDNKGSGTET